ncbi:gastrula zinc finger protein XlCGF49.1-like [Mercenaria mercenaria]|uniref:gastrula zinc finger protein XlCGF49.1-like n=1 Tax=Mercenaria mercenaria TaxID=6596 RepID=UPI00234EE3F6|nr:gastrula zinc finger protein XlCGF49.1-like [Mercenaria mercenaria]
MKFKYEAVFKMNLKTHSDQKPHNCEQCGKKFKRADLLTTHKKYHMEEKPFPCPECSKTFKVKQDMKKHFKIHLPPKFFCGICGKSFVQKHNLRIHIIKDRQRILPKSIGLLDDWLRALQLKYM